MEQKILDEINKKQNYAGFQPREVILMQDAINKSKQQVASMIIEKINWQHQLKRQSNGFHVNETCDCIIMELQDLLNKLGVTY